ncbi:MAG: hypothetical protein ACI9WL_000958, partial [Rubritalea sp.]
FKIHLENFNSTIINVVYCLSSYMIWQKLFDVFDLLTTV